MQKMNKLMPIDAVTLCSRALLKVGAKSISSFDENTVEAEVASSLYPVIRDALLASHPWSFATQRQSLPPVAETPVSDYDWRFQLPADCLCVLAATAGNCGRSILYRIAQRQLLANIEDPVLTYIGRPDETDFPPFFQLLLVATLAAEFCMPLTDSTSRWEALQKAADYELRRARFADSQDECEL